MPKLSVCVEMLFREDNFADRLRKVADLGIRGFEFWRQEGKDLQAIAGLRDELGLTWVGMVGTSLPLTDPGRTAEVVADLQRSVGVAADVGCQSLIVTSGPEQAGMDRQTQHDNIVRILQEVAPAAEAAQVTIVLEPLNTLVNHAGTYLSSSFEGYDIVDKVNSDKVKLLYDIYHQQITEGNVIANVSANIARIGHFHLADVPGRHEPGTGELHYANIFRAIRDTGYAGFIGCEYAPTGDAAASLQNTLSLMPERAM